MTKKVSVDNGEGCKKPRNRRRLQVGLRTLLIGVTLVACVFGCWHALIRPYQVQNEVRLRIQAVGGVCQTRPGPWYAKWILGAEHCQVVTEVDLADNVVVGSEYGFRYGPDLPSRDDEYPRLLIDLGQLTDVEQIDVRGCDVTDEILSTWDGLTHLQRLTLSHTLVQDATTWPAWPLEQLSVDSTPMEDQGLRPICKYASMKVLDANKTGCDDNTVAAWQVLQSLQKLNVADTRVSLRSRDELLAFPHMQTIRFLGRSSSQTSFNQLETLPALPTKLNDFPEIEDAKEWVRQNLRILQETRMQDFPIGAVASGDWCYPGGLDYSALLELGPRPEIQFLWLDSQYVDDETLQCLAQFPNLRRLSLQNSWITDEGLRYLAHCPQLELLSLINTRITDNGLRYLSHCPKLTNLLLGGTCISNRGLSHLTDLHQLERVYLPANAVRGTEPEMVVQLPHLRSLQVAAPGKWDRGSRIGEPHTLADVEMIFRIEHGDVMLFSFPATRSGGPESMNKLLDPKNDSLRRANALRWLHLSREAFDALPRDKVYEELIRQDLPIQSGKSRYSTARE